MRVLVIGANGFIGHHVVQFFGRQGHSVLQADIMPGTDASYTRIDPDQPDFSGLLELTKPDLVINCAGAASVPESLSSPFRDFTLNTARMAQLLDALRNRQAKLIHLSSAAVYGNPETSPVAENANLQPVSPYGAHKAMAESLCRHYAVLFGIKCLSVRIFSAYGPGLRKQLFWDLFQKGKAAGEVELFGTGMESRDFIYVDDLVRALEIIANRARFEGESINLASGQSVDVATAASTLFTCLGWERTLRFTGNARLGDPLRWYADIQTLKLMGFAPQFSIAQGLTKVASWLNEQS
jgi:UDP-glucose 4-epimerase